MRFWARVIDQMSLSLLIGIGVGILAPEALGFPGADYLMSMAVAFLWMFAETGLLTTFGTTPGKWILRIELSTANGNRLDPGAAMARSFKVWTRGLGIGAPLISFIAHLMAYSALKERGITSWDQEGGFVVVHRPIGWIRGTVTVLLAVAFVALTIAELVHG